MNIYDIFIIVGFFLYNFSLMGYAAHVFEYQKSVFKISLITSIINTIIVSALIIFATAYSEFVFIIVFVIIYTLEFRTMTNRGLLVVLFGVFSYAINLFSRRLIILALISLIAGVSMEYVSNNELFDFLVNIIPFAISLPSVYLTKKRLKRQSLHLLFSDKKILTFAVLLMGITLLYLVVIVFFTNAQNSDLGYVIMYLVSGIIITVSYYMAMIFAGMFSKLKIHVMRYEKISKSVKDEEESLRTIAEQALIDPITGFYIRDVATDEIKKCLNESIDFHIAYIDIDGLKSVNDTYGHTEGDSYIEAVVHILKTVFQKQIISRMGGDEFLVVSRTDEFDTSQRLMRAYLDTKAISKEYSKKYPTSFSYGLVDIKKGTSATVEKIIEEADNKMYAFKKARSKERK